MHNADQDLVQHTADKIKTLESSTDRIYFNVHELSQEKAERFNTWSDC